MLVVSREPAVSRKKRGRPPATKPEREGIGGALWTEREELEIGRDTMARELSSIGDGETVVSKTIERWERGETAFPLEWIAKFKGVLANRRRELARYEQGIFLSPKEIDELENRAQDIVNRMSEASEPELSSLKHQLRELVDRGAFATGKDARDQDVADVLVKRMTPAAEQASQKARKTPKASQE